MVENDEGEGVGNLDNKREFNFEMIDAQRAVQVSTKGVCKGLHIE